MKRIRKGDKVVVIAGDSKGQIGTVLKVENGCVVVENTNKQKKHVKPNPQLEQKGGIVERERAIDLSNVAMHNPVTNKADKVGFKLIEKDGKMCKVRYFKSNNELIDLV